MPPVYPPLIARPLTRQDAPAFERLYASDPFQYLTVRMNLDVFGFESATTRAWGAFTPDEAEMRGIMLRYSNTSILADATGVTAATFAPIIDAEDGLAGVRGSIDAVRGLRGALRRYSATGMEVSVFMQLPDSPGCPEPTLRLARRAVPDDLIRLADLYAGAGAMYRSRANVTDVLGRTRVFVAEEPASGRQPPRIVSCALLNVEGLNAALLGGVYTRPEARGRGYAAACTAALSLELQRDGKLPCLFYENPVAGRVYRRLGFREAAHWAVLFITK